MKLQAASRKPQALVAKLEAWSLGLEASGLKLEASLAGRLVMRLVRDETAVTTLEYVVAAVALALAAVAASRIIAGVLKNYLHRIYLVVTLPIP
jgi:Flp pilus assembly pilin Flp